MTREGLKQAIVEAIQHVHGFTQPGVGETVMQAIEDYLGAAPVEQAVGQ